MANADEGIIREPVGKDGREFHANVAASTAIYEGTMIAQLSSGEGMVPATTASSGAVIAVALHDADNSGGQAGDKRVALETDRVFIFAQTSPATIDEKTLIGTLVYCDDDHTVKATGTVAAGEFRGMEPDGRVRVLVSPSTVNAELGQTLPT